jgi:hypothetical protein
LKHLSVLHKYCTPTLVVVAPTSVCIFDDSGAFLAQIEVKPDDLLGPWVVVAIFDNHLSWEVGRFADRLLASIPHILGACGRRPD